MRPKNYTFLGKTDRIRVPYVKQFNAVLNELNRIAELGHDPQNYLEEFIERLELVE
jgi:molybdate-binding protein